MVLPLQLFHSPPVIAPSHVLITPLVDHGLHGENVPLLHHPPRSVVLVVRHVRPAVELGSNSVAAVGLHNCATALFRCALNELAQILRRVSKTNVSG